MKERPVQTVASAGRKQQGRRTVKLTRSQVAIAKKIRSAIRRIRKIRKGVNMMKIKINRTLRSSSERQERKKSWTPPSSLDAPPAPQGFKHRWIRTETVGQMDTGNVSKKLREGWEFVRAEEIKNSTWRS